MARISCLVTTYNRPEMLKRCVDSILSQTYRDFEIIVLDDNSSDQKQIELLSSYWGSDKIVMIKSNVAKGDRLKTTRYATMINLGLKVATGEFISYCCDDDFFEPEKFERMTSYFDASPHAEVVYGTQRCVEQKKDGELITTGLRPATSETLNASCSVDHSSVMHRKSLIDRYGAWEDDASNWGSGDAAFWRKLNDHGVVFYPINQTLDTHVYHDGSYTKEGSYLIRLKDE